jgi:TRAP-type C4-dicarboxylate transport system substrate-binding protein
VERSWSNLKELRLVEVAPHLTRVGHSVVPTYVLAGARVRAQVTPASWELLEVSATAAATREYEAYISADAVAVEALKISGIVPLEGDRMAFRRAAALVWTTFRKCPGIADALQAIGVTTP